jgi:hypothetical protein
MEVHGLSVLIESLRKTKLQIGEEDPVCGVGIKILVLKLKIEEAIKREIVRNANCGDIRLID